MLVCFFLKMIISTSLAVPVQSSPRFHVEAWLPFGNREMDYSVHDMDSLAVKISDANNETATMTIVIFLADVG